MRKANVYMYNKFAGLIIENEKGYSFSYDKNYLNSSFAEAISLTFPLSQNTYYSDYLFPFFDGLIPGSNILFYNW